MMGILWYACVASLWAMPLWSWMNQKPTYSVECSVTEVYPGGATTPSGSFTLVLREGDATGLTKGWTPLEGTWKGDPTLSIHIKAFDKGDGKFPLDVMVENKIETPDRGDGCTGRGTGAGCACETGDDFVMQLPKADEFGGHYEFAFHRKSTRWYRALLP
jgi:hypothetical protein